MSGIEVAGLILPILLTTFKNWDDLVRPFKRFKRFNQEARAYCDEVEIQRTIFRNECHLLLDEVTEHDTKIDAGLAALFGDSLQGVQLTIRLLNDELGGLSRQSAGLTDIVSEENEKTPKSSRDRAWKRRVNEKLRFSFSEKLLKRGLSKLESLNNSLVLLSNQTTRSISKTERTVENKSDLARPEVQRYRIVGKVSHQMYHALSRACNKHEEHLAHFGVEVEYVDFKGDLFAQVKFSMAFTHHTLTNVAAQTEPIWFLVDSIIDERVGDGSKYADGSLSANGLSLKREGSRSSAPKARPKKRVRFDAFEVACIPSPASVISTKSLEGSRRRDFCDHLRKCFCPPLQKDVCVVLEQTGQCKHLVLPSSLTGNAGPRQAVSLGQLIHAELLEDAVPGVVSGIPVHERIKLAKILAITVLQYHDTPWLSQLWTSEDIFFYRAPPKSSVLALPDISAPHLNARITPQQTHTQTLSKSTLARNPFLFSLGAVMIELAYGCSLDGLQQPCDIENGLSHRRFFTARRLAKQARSPMGLRYNDIVEQLIEGVFPKGANLDDVRVQKKLYEDVVCPLEDLEREFEKLYFFDEEA